MRIFVTIKQLGKRRDVLGRIPFDLPEAPRTLRDLLTMMVETMVAQYNARKLETPVFHYLTEDDLRNSAELDISRPILLAVWSIGCLPNRKPDGKFKKWERNFSISMSCGYMILYHFPKTNQHGK